MAKTEGITDSVNSAVFSERIGFGDIVLSAVIAAVAFLLSTLWQFPAMAPSSWESLAISAGVRPAEVVMCGYSQLIGGVVFGLFGVDWGLTAMRLLAHLFFALTGMGVYGLLRELFVFIRRARPQYSSRRTFVVRVAATMGAIAFLCSDPVWSSGQTFSDTTVRLFLTIWSLAAFFVYIRRSSIVFGYLCTLFIGLLAAESPFGILLAALFLFGNAIMVRLSPGDALSELGSSAIGGKWYMTFLFLFTVVSGVFLNCVGYIHASGLEANGLTIGDLPLRYAQAYMHQCKTLAGPAGWVLFVGVAVAPFIMTFFNYANASDEERMLPYPTGVSYLMCCVIAAFQSVGIRGLWYWTYGDFCADYLLSIGAFLSAATVSAAVSVLGINALCRNSNRLTRHFLGVEGTEPDDGGEKSIGSGHRRLILCSLLAAVPVLLVVAMVPGRFKGGTRAMMALVEEAVASIVEEAGDAKFIFTDGNLDPAIELAARRAGREVYCVSIISGSAPRDQMLRTRGLEADDEDMFSFRHNGGMGLRSWVRDRPARLAASAVQVGFDLWKRDGHAIPEIGGLLSRPGVKQDPERTAAFVSRAHDLAKRMLALVAKGAMNGCTDVSVKNAYTAVMWRLSRMCVYRGERYDLSGEPEKSIAETALAKALNDGNEVFKRLVENAKVHNAKLMKRFTPREGLQLALVRADFPMAKLYAEAILKNEPEHGDANFAMGMFHLKANQLSLAEEYFKRCLIQKPKEATIYNNLAMLQAELGKYNAALINVEKAAELLPDSDMVKDTRKYIIEKRDGKPKDAPERERGI